MSDVVYIRALEVESLIGVYDFERHAKQPLLLDLELDFDCAPAGKTDDLKLALDYDQLSQRVRAWCSQQRFELIESLAEGLCQLLHQEFAITRLVLTINKPMAIKGCAAVGIKIERSFRS